MLSVTVHHSCNFSYSCSTDNFVDSQIFALLPGCETFHYVCLYCMFGHHAISVAT